MRISGKQPTPIMLPLESMSSEHVVIQDLLQQGLHTLKLDLDNQQQIALLNYITLLTRWNQAYNLTAVRDPKQMVIRHLLDSLAIAPYLQGPSIIDIGTGAGLPGIPLAIVFPHYHWVLLDSNGKKMRFLFQVLQDLGLANVELVQKRVENYCPKQKFNSIISRAFASITQMLIKSAHLAAAEGYFLAMKGMQPDEELRQLPEQFSIQNIQRLHVPGLNEQRHLISIKKHVAYS